MPTWADALVVSVTYLLFSAGLLGVLWRASGPERIRFTEPLDKHIERTLTSDSDYWGLT